MAKRYDITPVAESLLGEQRSRRKSEDSDKDLWTSLALQLGIGMGNRLLSKKADEFASSEKVMAARVANENALENANYTKQTRQSIVDTNKSDEQFFADNSYERIKARRLADLDESTLSANGMDAFEAQIREEARTLGVEQAERFRESETVAGTIMDTEDFEAYITLKNQRPRNVGNWLTDKIGNIFGGKDQGTLDNEAIEAIEREGVMKGEKLEMLREAYSKGLDLTSSYELADKVFQEKSPTSQIDTEVKQVDGKLVAVIKTQKIAKNGAIVGKPTFKTENLGDFKDADETTLIKSMNEYVNILDTTDTFFNQDAKAKFSKELLDKGINIVSPKTLLEYEAAKNLFAEYLTDSNNLKDVYKEERMTEIIKQTGKDIFTLEIADILSIEDPDERVRKFNEFVIKFANTTKSAKDTAAPVGNTYSGSTGRVSFNDLISLGQTPDK